MQLFNELKRFDLTFRPAVTPAEKLVQVAIDTTQPGKSFFFETDDELNNALIIGIKFQPAGILFLKDAFGNFIGLSDSQARWVALTMVDLNQDYILENYPLQQLGGSYNDDGLSLPQKQMLQFENNTRSYWKGNYLCVFPDGPLIQATALLSVVYVPKHFKKH